MPSAQNEPVELDLLRAWREPVTSHRVLRDALGSLAIHAFLAAAFWLAPEVEVIHNAPTIASDLKRNAIKLEVPRYFEPTQKAPNHGEVRHELDTRSAVEGTTAQVRRFRPPSPPPAPPQPATAPLVVDAPRIDLPQSDLPASSQPRPLPALPSPNLPAPPAAPKPAPETAKNVTPPAVSGAGVKVGDVGIDQPNIPGTNQTPAPCQTCSTLQLLSDPQNVDFQPYLLQVLQVVKRNWLTVIPDAARRGGRGVVTIRFIIDKTGTISSLVISSPSGTGVFDRAAIAGMSMSNPFPPLPAAYKGNQIRLQMAFAYNPADKPK
jgi:TonB family protein